MPTNTTTSSSSSSWHWGWYWSCRESTGSSRTACLGIYTRTYNISHYHYFWLCAEDHQHYAPPRYFVTACVGPSCYRTSWNLITAAFSYHTAATAHLHQASHASLSLGEVIAGSPLKRSTSPRRLGLIHPLATYVHLVITIPWS